MPHRVRASRDPRFHNVAAIHSCAVLRIQFSFSFALKHSERFREPDIEEAVVNRGFLAPVPEQFAGLLQRSNGNAVCWPGAS
jgi:hypothetical protein